MALAFFHPCSNTLIYIVGNIFGEPNDENSAL